MLSLCSCLSRPPEIIEFKKDDNECPICKDALSDKNSIAKPGCGHFHHIHCLDEWKLKNDSCTICRAPIKNLTYYRLDEVDKTKFIEIKQFLRLKKTVSIAKNIFHWIAYGALRALAFLTKKVFQGCAAAVGVIGFVSGSIVAAITKAILIILSAPCVDHPHTPRVKKNLSQTAMAVGVIAGLVSVCIALYFVNVAEPTLGGLYITLIVCGAGIGSWTITDKGKQKLKSWNERILPAITPKATPRSIYNSIAIEQT